jgi:hypothetical protein
VTVTGVDEFIPSMHDHLVNPTPKDLDEFKKSGFVSAILDTRFFPLTPDGPHTPRAPHLFALLMQFESDDGAETAVEILHADGLRPCPGRCAGRVLEFDVDGTPDAKGVRRVATAEEIKAFGEKGRPPSDAYEIRFADGPFAYTVELRGAPGSVSEEQAEEIVEKLYDRVEGAPPAGE